MKTLYLEGNNGGDIFELRVLDDGRIALEVGHCCVKEVNHILPVEWLTSVITNAVLDAGGVIEAFGKVEWPEDYKAELLGKIEDNSIKARLGWK